MSPSKRTILLLAAYFFASPLFFSSAILADENDASPNNTQVDALYDGKTTAITLRKESKNLANQSDIDKMVDQWGFFERERNPQGDPQNAYVKINDEVVMDKRTGLMWQRSGSDRAKSFTGAKDYIEQLNDEKFSGYSDWRLPTIEELSSLLVKTPIDELDISPIFDHSQKRCWSNDTTDTVINFRSVKNYAIWIVDFSQGQIKKAIWYFGSNASDLNSRYSQNKRNYVKAVRSFQ